MKYVIVSPRIGTPGEIYNPEVVVNLGALLAGGFIKALDIADAEETAEEPAPTPVKSAKTNSKKASTEE